MAVATPCQFPISMQQLGLTKQQLPLTLASDHLFTINRSWVSRKESKILDTNNLGNPSENNITSLMYRAGFRNTWEWKDVMSNIWSFLQQEVMGAFMKWRLGYFQKHMYSCENMISTLGVYLRNERAYPKSCIMVFLYKKIHRQRNCKFTILLHVI